ncbi:unnamed protein product [Pleuronectes platessa]|uniref:Uncharacterized protein n=1 Tax=Pleuronectes platessa TaxID=8262 RepID=A0A9N7UCV8_PLEPL|nr:unnamed protein product [Pleuronectes platessa]
MSRCYQRARQVEPLGDEGPRSGLQPVHFVEGMKGECAPFPERPSQGCSRSSGSGGRQRLGWVLECPVGATGKCVSVGAIRVDGQGGGAGAESEKCSSAKPRGD